MKHLPSSFRQVKIASELNLPGKGRGLFAQAPLVRGEVLAVFGGTVLHAAQLEALTSEERLAVVQIDENLFLWSVIPGPGDWINHSCQPNAGLCGQIVLVALRDIGPGEEICYDYAMSDGSAYDQFECCCGTALCREVVTGNDWRRPELIARYWPHFSPYLVRRMQREMLVPDDEDRHAHSAARHVDESARLRLR